MDKTKKTGFKQLQNQKLNSNLVNKKIKEFLSEINNKKEVIRAFKKRYINHTKKNKEKNEKKISIKLNSINNFIDEFEKLIQFSLELILLVKEGFGQKLNSKKLNIDNNDLYNEDYYNSKYYKISNLDIKDKLKHKRQQSISKISSNNNYNNIYYQTIENNYNRNNSYKNNISNFRNYYSVRNLSNKDFTNNNKNSTINYNCLNDFPSLKEKTLRTLYQKKYFQPENNNFLNEEENKNEMNIKKIKIPIRKTLRALIKEKKLNKNINYINNNIENNKKNEEGMNIINKKDEFEGYRFNLNEKYGNRNNLNF